MQRKDRGLESLFDIRAVRVFVDDVKDCYARSALCTTSGQYLPGEFDDYIANPKDNDYRSLHTAVIGPEGKTLEVQIRSHEMHRQAELGVAAHWRYKEGGGTPAAFDQKIRFLRQLLEPTATMAQICSTRFATTCSRIACTPSAPRAMSSSYPPARRRWTSPITCTRRSGIAAAARRSTGASCH